MKKLLFILLFFFSVSLSAQVECGLTPFWSRVQVYEIGEFVQYYGLQYKAVNRNTGATPDLSPGNWLKIDSCVTNETILDCSGISDWDPSQIYVAGDQVVSGRGIYQSLYSNSNNPPATNTNNGAYAWIFVGRCESSTVSQCDISTPSFTFDLTGSPDSAWVSPQVRRSGLCCDVPPEENPPFRCVEFFFTLDEDAIGIIFDIETGAVPPGALFFQINCVGRYQFGELLCLSGKGPYRLTFCKPGNNPNTYIIRSIGKPKVGPPVTVSDGCTAELSSSGYDISTIVWSSVPSNPLYESYLSCTEQCDTITATYQAGAPDSVVYQVSGFPPGGCMKDPVVQQVTVYFVNEKTAYIIPEDPMVCYGSTDAEITVYPDGGRPPHRFLWSTGETAQTIRVGEGTYSVEVYDNTTCPSTSTSVVVGAYLFPIVADAGPDQVLCESTTQVPLLGTIEEALGGKWSGGLGQFLPNDSTLDAIYVPTQTEIDNGSVTLILTTTGNRGCPGDDDQVTISFERLPVIAVPDTLFACKSVTSLSVSGTFTNSSGLRWNSITGGSILPNDSANPISYVPNNSELTNEISNIEVTTIQNNTCPPVKDTVTIIYYPDIFLDPLNDTVLCLTSNSLQLNANYTPGASVLWSAGSDNFVPNNSISNPVYQFTSSEKLSPTVTINVSVTDENNCNSLNESMIITWFDAPTVNAGPNQQLCETVVSANLSATSSFVSLFDWSSLTGSFINGNTANPTYQISPLDTANGFVDLTVIGSSEFGCGSDTDVVRLIFFDAPEITVTRDYQICKEVQTLDFSAEIFNASSIQWTSNGSGVISVINNRSIKYQLDIADTNLASIQIIGSTTNIHCPAVNDEANITFRELPTIVSVTGIEVCEETPIANLVGTSSDATAYRWIGGNGTFFPNRNSLTVNYTPTFNEIQSGSIGLSLSTANTQFCSEDTATVEIQVIFTPEVSLGGNLSICSDQESIVVSANTTNSTAGFWSGGSNNFSPDSSFSTVNYFFDEQDYEDSLVTLFYTTNDDNTCQKITDNIQIRLYEPLMVNIGSNIRICELQDTVKLPNAGISDSLVTWSTNGTGTIRDDLPDEGYYYFPSVSDKLSGSTELYITTKAYRTCNVYSDTIVIFYDNIPQLNLGPDIIICESNLPVSIEAIGNVGEWVGNGVFELGVSNNFNTYYPSIDELALDTIELIFNTSTFNSCPSISDTLNIFLLNGPSFTLSPLADQCASTAEIEVTGVFENFANVQWSTSGDGNLLPNVEGDTLIYEPTVLEKSTNDSLELRFTVSLTDTGNCELRNQVVTMYLIPRTYSDNVRFETICSNQTSIQLNPVIDRLGSMKWTTSGTETFTPSDDISSPVYSFSLADLSQDSLLFVLSSINDELCENQIDSLYMFIEPQLIYTPLKDTAICQENTSLDFEVQVLNNTGFSWSTNGDGFFQPNNSLSTEYFISIIDTTKTNVEIYFSAQSLGICPDILDTAILTLNDPILYSNGTSFVQCKDVSQFTLDLGIDPSFTLSWDIIQGGGTLSNPSIANPVYSFVSDDYSKDSLVFGVASNSPEFCASDYAEITVYLLEVPNMSVKDYIICESASGLDLDITTENSVLSNWSTNGNGVLTQIDLENASYEHLISDSVLASIQVFVEVKGDSTCALLYDTIDIILHEEPIVEAGENQILCLDATSIALSGEIVNGSNAKWTTNGSGTLLGSGIKGTNYFFTNSDKSKDSILFTLTSDPDLYCPLDQDQMTVRFSEPPTVLSNNQVLCSVDGEINLSPGLVDNVINYYWSSEVNGVFSPSDRDSVVTFTSQVSGLDTVIIKLVVESCLKDSIEIILLSKAPSEIEVPDSMFICEAQSNELEATGLNVNAYLWSTNGSGNLIDPNANPTTYQPSAADLLNKEFQFFVEGKNPEGCPSDYDTIHVIVLEKPNFVFGSEKIVCPEYLNVPVQTQMDPIYTTVNWSSSSNGFFIGSSDPKLNTYLINQNDINEGRAIVYIKQEAFECFNEIIDSVLITFYDSTKIDVGGDLFVCGEDVGVRVNSNFQNSSGVQWTTTGSGIIQNPQSKNTDYFFTDEDIVSRSIDFVATTRGSLCSPVSDTMTVFLLPTPTIDIGEDLLYCNETPKIELKSLVENGTSVNWYTTGQGNFLNPITDIDNIYNTAQSDTAQGNIIIGVTANVNGNCLAADQLNVIFEKNPIINLNDPNACKGEVVTISGTPINVFRPVDEFIWTKDGVVLPNKDSLLSVLNEGVYGVEIYMGKCYATASTKITFNENPEVPPLKKYPICPELGEEIIISSRNSIYSTYWFHTDVTSMTTIASQLGTYNYRLTNQYGCDVIGEVELIEVCAPRLFTPTIFTPNGDGISDYMTVAGAYIYTYDLKIFNRWGEVIFWTDDMNEYWDGYYREELMPEGTYNWTIEYGGRPDYYGEKQMIKGAITLVR